MRQHTEAMEAATTGPGTRPGTSFDAWRKVIGLAFGLSLLVGIAASAFAWPAAESGPREVPVAVVGPREAVAQVEQQLDAAVPDGFDLKPVADADAARELIADRDVYGAIVLDPAGPPQVLTASAASPAVAQVLQGITEAMAQQVTGTPVLQVDDVVALPDDDPRGAGFNATALPMVIGGMIIGTAMSLAVAGAGRKITGALVAAGGSGLTAAVVVQTWLGALEGDYLANAGVIALVMAAISLTFVGLKALLGNLGLTLGVLVMFLLGNPLSGVTSAPEMLPAGWGTLGQALPPGAGGSLLRSTAFFDGAAAGGPILVLSSWAVGGLLLAITGWAVRERRSTPALRDGEAVAVTA